jgi:hypothetical protein
MDSGRRGIRTRISDQQKKDFREFAAYEAEEKHRLHNSLLKSGTLDKIRTLPPHRRTPLTNGT